MMGVCCGQAQPGDLLFVRTPGRLIALGRAATRNPYDHVAVVTEGQETMNIVKPRTLMLPVARFTKPGNASLLMRPQWEDAGQRDAFLREMGRFEDCEYNVRKTIEGIFVSLFYTRLGVKIHLRGCEQTGTWICTEAILVGLKAAVPAFCEIDRLGLDYTAIGFATTRDFFTITRDRPDLLKIVEQGGGEEQARDLAERVGFEPTVD